MNILGLNAFHGDASAALLADGTLAAAVEEERFNRVKHWAGFPALSARWCLDSTSVDRLGHVAISRDPRAHFWKKAARVIARPGDWRRIASRAKNSADVSRVALRLAQEGFVEARQARIHFVEHHRAHLASAFFPSPYEEAAVVSIDGFGDFSSVMWGVGRGNRIDTLDSVQFPHSLGLFYTAFTQFLGFPHYGDEYKMMGLAAFGEPRFAAEVREVVAIEGARIRLNLDYFVHHTKGVEMTWAGGSPELGPVFSSRLAERFGPPRRPDGEIEQQHADLAASVQQVLEERYFALLNEIHRRTKLTRLCLAGGVALNCAANGKIFEKTPFREVYIQAAANDSGTAIGAALHVWHQTLGHARAFEMRHVYFGPEFSREAILRDIEAAGVVHRELDEAALIDFAAGEIASGKIAGWFQGRMEFGPRALGARSILADPRRKEMRDILNRRIKHREPFRPFCPSVLAEACGDYFETAVPSPFMVQAFRIKPEKRASIPAVTHEDGTGRVQTVERDVNPLFWKLIRRFGDLTGVPLLINTSFNENEPIVQTPAQAIDCFLRTEMDTLVIGPFACSKPLPAPSHGKTGP